MIRFKTQQNPVFHFLLFYLQGNSNTYWETTENMYWLKLLNSSSFWNDF